MPYQLRDLAPKKWVGDYGGNAPVVGSSSGIMVGDLAIDTSTVPHSQWRCVDNNESSLKWENICKPSGAVSIDSGQDTVTVGGLGLSNIPAVVILTIAKPSANDMNIAAVLDGGSLSRTGFTAHLTASTDKAGYKLHYLLLP